MRTSTFLTAAAYSWLVSAGPRASETLQRRAQCASTLSTANTVATQLQTWYDANTGNYNDGELWTDSNAVEDLHNLMLAASTTTWASVDDTSRIGRAAENPSTDWGSIVAGSWDDSQWIILALWKVADYRAAHGQDITPFMNAASQLYNIVAGQWDDTCGGGVWWSSAHTYKNAVTNELFLLTSASGYLRTGNQTFLTNAQKVWAWLEGSGMRNSQGLWNDGLDFNTCQNNGQTTWTYNQGVIASGLGALYTATGNTTLLDQAEVTLDATIAHLTVNNILKESCDDASSPNCDHNQQIFKGIWMKHVQYYLDNANDASRTAKYAPFLGSQSSAAFHFGKDAANDVGSVWYAPDQGGSIFSPEATTSGLACFVSAAKVRHVRILPV
ncbi:Six-hairpin glycosidase [Vararia minispora EC-137]|uniref:Six-hairpin glycosidase n=1 Tax=Vararia minispora EC-137 TaxID=1314806 RepID=A0ACB8QA34_9AGAM|nr:Six-hairpin glycosidase [Vararia minispora EC-137]